MSLMDIVNRFTRDVKTLRYDSKNLEAAFLENDVETLETLATKINTMKRALEILPKCREDHGTVTPGVVEFLEKAAQEVVKCL